VRPGRWEIIRWWSSGWRERSGEERAGIVVARY